MAASVGSSTPTVPSFALLIFFPLTFAMTWGTIGAYILYPAQTTAWFGEINGSHPLYFFATWGPAVAGILLVAFYTGVQGLRLFFSRLLIWRCAPTWWLFILVGIPLVFMAGSIVKGGPFLAPLPPEGAGPMLALAVMMLFLGPVEEFGWRGVAQPLLQRYVAPIWAGAIIGAIWGIWHLPAFYLSGVVYADWSFIPFFVGNVTLAILVAPIFNNTQGSLLLPVLFHWQLINPFWPDAQPYDSWILVAVAAVVVWLNQERMFSRHGAVTDVIPGAGEEVLSG